MNKASTYKVIISGGGTGGHIFPAIAIADGLRESGLPVEILFVGANGRMEMQKVPAAGYEIVGLDVVGFQRSLSLKNLLFPFKLLKSIGQAIGVIRRFKPDVAVGVGGYASGPVLFLSSMKCIPAVIQEQNSYPGITNKILKFFVSKICVAYPGMERFFPEKKLVYTGNPVRSNIIHALPSREEACAFFGLDPAKPVLLSFGGSLGAGTFNDSIEAGMPALKEAGIQVIWQTGSYYFPKLSVKWEGKLPEGILLKEFLYQMDMAYAAADVIVSRAGALSISELCIVGKATILVPSPNVAEDHQTKNAMALVNKGAAIMVADAEARQVLIPTAIELIRNREKADALGTQIKTFARPDATAAIVNEIKQLIVR